MKRKTDRAFVPTILFFCMLFLLACPARNKPTMDQPEKIEDFFTEEEENEANPYDEEELEYPADEEDLLYEEEEYEANPYDEEIDEELLEEELQDSIKK